VVAHLTLRVVIDTNVVLRGFARSESAAGKIVDAAASRRLLLLLDKPVLDEYRAILLDEDLRRRFGTLSPKLVELILTKLRYLGDYVSSHSVRFEYPRDPRDAKFVELAIAGKATHLVSGDKDLLSLPHGRSDAAKRFRQRLPRLSVLNPEQFIQRFENIIRGDVHT